MDWTSHNKAPLISHTLTMNINSDAVGLDQEKTLPTDLMKPVMGLIPVAKRTKKKVGNEGQIHFEHYLLTCLHGGGGPRKGEVTHLGGVTYLSI